MPKIGKPKRAMMKKAATLTAGVVASCGLMMAAPAAAHASSTTATPHAISPHAISPHAVTPNCGAAVEVYLYTGDFFCITSNGIHYVDICDVDWVGTGNQWAAWIYGNGIYHPGMAPGNYWNGYGTCISRIDVNT